MTTPLLCLAVGLVLGLALALGGFGALLVVALFGAAGFVIGKVLDGEIDLGRLQDSVRRQ